MLGRWVPSERRTDEIDHAVDRGVEKTATSVESAAKRKAPVETAKLQHSIKMRRLQTRQYIVGTDLSYAPDVEYGTSPHTITADGDYLYFQGSDGQLIQKKSVEHPGTKAQPFLRPALLEHKSELVRNIEEEIEKTLRWIFK